MAVYILGALLVLLLVGGTVLQGATPLLSSAGVVPVPEKYVALYFLKPAALPTVLTPEPPLPFDFRNLLPPAPIPTHPIPTSPLVFDFEIANHYAGPIIQWWKVTVVSSGGVAVVVGNGMVHLRAGRTATVAVSVSVPLSPSAIDVEVALPGRPLAPLEFHVTSSTGAPAP